MKKLLALLLLLSCPAWASQNPTQLPTSSPYAGLTMLNNINSAFNTFQTNFSGALAPSTPYLGQLWVNTSNDLLQFYNGSNWEVIGNYYGTQWVPYSEGIPFVVNYATGSANAYILNLYTTAYIVGQHYPFIANFQNTGAATLNVNSLGAVAIKKQGGTALASGDIVSGAVVDTVYDGTNMQMLSQVGNSSSGTVTSIATNNGVCGGTITSSGTLGLCSISNGSILGNLSGGSAFPGQTTLSQVMDSNFGTTSQGAITYRGSSAWTALAPGSNGQPLLSGGSGANPSFGNLPVGNISASGTASSSTFLRGDGSWQTLGATSCSLVNNSCSAPLGCATTATCSTGVVTGGWCTISSTHDSTMVPPISTTSTSWTCGQSGSASSVNIYCCL